MKFKKHISNILVGALLATILFFFGNILYQIQESKHYIFEKSPFLLEKAVRTSIEKQSAKIYYASTYKYNPEEKKIGEYETRTATYADTTFVFQKKITDPATETFNAFQTLLLDIGQLHADSIQFIFDDLLKEENIYAESVIGITASFYTKLNDWSSDTTAINTNYRTVFANQGNYEDINYHAYIHYSFSTLWKLIPKTLISILLICTIIIGIVLLWWLRKRKKEERNGIALLKDGNYRIKDIKFNVKEKTLTSEGAKEEIILPRQLKDLLLLFLEANHHKVSKEDIKQKFWSKNISAITNMTSAVNRLNKSLKEVNCPYTVITDPKEEKYYILSNKPT